MNKLSDWPIGRERSPESDTLATVAVQSNDQAQPFGTLPIDFVPIHVSLACVFVMALLVGWDSRRRGKTVLGSGHQRSMN